MAPPPLPIDVAPPPLLPTPLLLNLLHLSSMLHLNLTIKVLPSLYPQQKGIPMVTLVNS